MKQGNYIRTPEMRLKRSLAMKGKKQSLEFIEKRIAPLRGRKRPPFSAEHRLKMSLARKGKPPAHGFTEETRRKISESQRGEKGSNWKGGITPYHSRCRNSFDYRLFKEKVLARDNNTCVLCGISPKDNPHVTLNVDHIKQFKQFPELQFDINNGRTLCLLCHKKTHTYGNRKST